MQLQLNHIIHTFSFKSYLSRVKGERRTQNFQDSGIWRSRKALDTRLPRDSRLQHAASGGARDLLDAGTFNHFGVSYESLWGSKFTGELH